MNIFFFYYSTTFRLCGKRVYFNSKTIGIPKDNIIKHSTCDRIIYDTAYLLYIHVIIYDMHYN